MTFWEITGDFKKERGCGLIVIFIALLKLDLIWFNSVRFWCRSHLASSSVPAWLPVGSQIYGTCCTQEAQSIVALIYFLFLSCHNSSILLRWQSQNDAQTADLLLKKSKKSCFFFQSQVWGMQWKHQHGNVCSHFAQLALFKVWPGHHNMGSSFRELYFTWMLLWIWKNMETREETQSKRQHSEIDKVLLLINVMSNWKIQWFSLVVHINTKWFRFGKILNI